MESGGPHQTQGLCRASWSHMGWEQWALWLQGDAGGHPPHRLFYALLLIPSYETP